MTLQAGQLFGNYRIVRLIGEGGFGEVYLAENSLIERHAVVKVLHPALAQDAELVRRFLNEARAASAIRHPNIIEVFDAGGTPEGAPYILMEFLEGVSLQTRLAERVRLAVSDALEIAGQAGSALAAAHAAGIVHRDLKPENLFLVPDPSAPGGERVKILDFGIAKIKHGSKTGRTRRTQAGLVMGSPAYMSPEQCTDSSDVDLRSDIYSFATIIYEMLAGQTPFVATTGTALLVMHLTETARPLRALAGNVPTHVEAAIARALARARDDRFDSIASFLRALRGDAEPSVAAHSARRPAGGTRRALGVKRTATLAGATTFSRATGELAVPNIAVAISTATRPHRWALFSLGGAIVASLVFVVMSRPSHSPAPGERPGASTGFATASASPVEPAGQAQLGNADQLAPLLGADGAPPSAAARTTPATESGSTPTLAAAVTPVNRHHANPRTPISTRQRATAGSNPLAHAPVQSTQQKPEDVTGF
jgi:serine/threonine-protein kinase